jgi:hypothetical protein
VVSNEKGCGISGKISCGFRVEADGWEVNKEFQDVLALGGNLEKQE